MGMQLMTEEVTVVDTDCSATASEVTTYKFAYYYSRSPLIHSDPVLETLVHSVSCVRSAAVAETLV